MNGDTHFLPSPRLSRADVEAQAKSIVQHGLLLKLVTASSEALAILNPQRQIVFCNEACWRLGGLSSHEEAIGLRPGELLRCVNVADSPGGCGTTEKCRFCGLARALVQGQQGLAAAGRCLIESGEPGMGAVSEYRAQVTPLPEAGPGWECYVLTDISHEARRRELERAFFHDIMNRAFAVGGVADALSEEGLAPVEREELTTLLGVSVRGLVEEIKSQRVLLAAESGELSVDPVRLNCLEVLRDAVQTCAAFWLDEDVRLEIALGSQAVEFESDAALVGRILVNLLKNAIESSTSGQTVSAHCRREGDEVQFFVHNERFMEPAVASHVFQRLFSTKGHGRGLGTNSVRLLTEQYLGGKVSFETSQDSGTTFQIRLPLQARPAPCPDTSSPLVTHR